MSALSDLLKKNNKSKVPKVAAAAVTATVVAFSFAKLTGSENNDSSAQSDSSGAAAFASNNLTMRPEHISASSGTNGEKGSSGSMAGAGSDGIISDDALEDFIPPEGIVARDGKGNVIYKRCRKLTEGQVTAKAEMEKERARYDKFATAARKYLSPSGNGGDAGYTVNNCAVSGKKVPKESPCPSYQEYTSLRDFYSQQYYEMSNQLQRNASLDEQCKGPRDLVMAAADPNWRSDRSIASEAPSALETLKGTR